MHLCVPFTCIESSLFSFCHIQCLHDLPLSKLERSCAAPNLWSTIRQNVVVEVPTWLHQNPHSYLNSLSALSLPQLTSATTSLQCATSCPKFVQVRAVLHNFFEQCPNLWEIIRNSSSPCAISVSHFFLNPYQNSVFHMLCDLRSSNHFRTDDTSSCLNLVPSPHTLCSFLWILDCITHRRMTSYLPCIQSLPISGHNIVLGLSVCAVHLSCFTSGLEFRISLHFPTTRFSGLIFDLSIS